MIIEERLEKLEKELSVANRRIRCLVTGLILCMGCALLFGISKSPTLLAQNAADVAKEVRANCFLLQDKKGRVRVGLSEGDEGAGLVMADEKGNKRVSVGCYKEGTGLALFDDNNATFIDLHVTKEGPSMTFADEKGNPCIVLNSTKKDGPSLEFFKNGKLVARLGADTMTKTEGKAPAPVDVSLMLYGQDGKLRWRTPG